MTLSMVCPALSTFQAQNNSPASQHQLERFVGVTRKVEHQFFFLFAKGIYCNSVSEQKALSQTSEHKQLASGRGWDYSAQSESSVKELTELRSQLTEVTPCHSIYSAFM